MTLVEACRMGENILLQSEVEDAHLDAWYLLEYVTGVSRAAYYAVPDKQLTEKEEERYVEYIKKRAQRIPLQHLTGVQEFMGLEFQVSAHVLIPRQDTEVLVEEALGMIGKQAETWKSIMSDKKNNAYCILDMCTGSGCVLLSILHYVGEKYTLTADGTGTDISLDALKIAESNACKLGVKAKFLHSDLFQRIEGKYQMIVSNPPYIKTSVIETLQEEVKVYDPFIALDGKDDGLYFYRIIIKEAAGYLTKGGCLLFEIGADQGEAVQFLMKSAGYKDVLVKKDLAGLDRVVTGVYDK
jgi:release factor glutamine methyltransferase